MSVVGKSTCSGFKTGLYISYHDGNAVRYIKERSYFLKDGRISGYFDTKYMTVLQIEQILHSFEDWTIANFFQPQTGQFSRDTCHLCFIPLDQISISIFRSQKAVMYVSRRGDPQSSSSSRVPLNPRRHEQQTHNTCVNHITKSQPIGGGRYPKLSE